MRFILGEMCYRRWRICSIGVFSGVYGLVGNHKVMGYPRVLLLQTSLRRDTRILAACVHIRCIAQESFFKARLMMQVSCTWSNTAFVLRLMTAPI